ncbi:MAG TPA: hypothetical protein VMJ34_21375 [Bryobacteraceae bacterium]|nr:hypothetical protein [Bryobacteraceae bacterium]
MDIYKAIQELIQEKKRLDAVIASLESRSNGALREKKRRGRKSMSTEERAAVSRRMAAYWAARRGDQNAGSASSGSSREGPEAALPMARAAASGVDAAL